ncbi:hypothetical protein HNQ07_003810 [Deinococcus metalli]|uniref:DUF937 domain-containing protein n=1 Tax=Deinococcus metalli TaxID=1141878 RepID=A0A7W8NPT9_9DEIO|nr:DUF937 domain-containing protein [Deinococcus metalli]MBB5378304.1 hypothetical protein [Deinococcus metalli]GHF59863.1 hypothetical protein GCM10017781_40270 [Deinococcus metalli]
MNVMDTIQTFFSPEASARLGQSAGLDAPAAQRALEVGLPLQLDALAEYAGRPEGQAQIAEAVENLPDFGSVAAALDDPAGAETLERAGELLAPALLGGRADAMAAAVAAQTGGAPAGVTRLLHMALPLLLSVLGHRGGLTAGNAAALLAGAGGLAAASPAAEPSGDVLEFVRGQFSSPAAEKIGAAAGFAPNAAGRATLAALPLVLAALVSRARAGGDVLALARPFAGLSDDHGHVNPQVLDTPADLARIEGQGRRLLGTLFGNADALTGRLGTALGGSGSSAGRLLALLTPLVLAVLGGRARAGNLDAAGFGTLLGGLGGRLAGLLPAGLGSLGALLGADGLTTMLAPGASAAPAPAPRPAAARPAATTTTATPAPAAPAPVPPASTPPAARRRGGFPWWLIPLLVVLLLGGCWLLNRRPATVDASTGTGTAATGTATGTGTDTSSTAAGTDSAGTATADTATSDTTGTTSTATDPATTGSAATDSPGTDSAGTAGSGGAMDGSFMISEPAADATLPAGGFTLRGMGKAGDEVELFEDDTSLGKLSIGQDGNWSFDVPSPAAGKHTYSVRGPGGASLGSVAVTIGAADANASAAACTDEYSLSITDGQAVSEPFRFGGQGQGQGYRVTVKRGERTIGVKDIPLDSTCGWSYQSRPGAGAIRYEVRPLGEPDAAPLSAVGLTVNQ